MVAKTGPVTLTVRFECAVLENPFSEMVIDLASIGLVSAPNVITDASGSSRLFDAARPPICDADGMHLYFSPPLKVGTYGFCLNCKYNIAVVGVA